MTIHPLLLKVMSRIIIILLLFFICGQSFGQKKSEHLKQKERQLRLKIKTTKELIKKTRNSEQLTLTEIGIIQHQIAYREELIANYNYQLRRLDIQVKDINKQIVSINNNIKMLKQEYEKMLLYAYKNRNTDYSYLYIISAKTFSEAFHRMKYIQHYSDYRLAQIHRILLTQKELEKKIDEIEIKIANKEKLTTKQKIEKQDYLTDKDSHHKSLFKLKQNEEKLKSQLAAQKLKKRKLASAIRKAIEDEIAAATKKSGSTFSLTPDAISLSKNFTSNKGKLPWPVERGEITGRYGKHKHNIVTTATIDNNGIDITTEKNAKVRAVFNGKVTSVLIIPGAGKVVMISHGSYRTVYANLKNVYVKKGDKIKTKQNIGELLEVEKSSVSQAHFEIWNISSSSMKTENPSYWIVK